MLTTASWLQQRWHTAQNTREHLPAGVEETVRALAARLAAAPASNPQTAPAGPAGPAEPAAPAELAAEEEADQAASDVRNSLRSLKTIARDRPVVVAAEAWAPLLDALAALVCPLPPLPSLQSQPVSQPQPQSQPAVSSHAHTLSQQGEDLARQRALQFGRMREVRRHARERARVESLTALIDTLTALCDEAPFSDESSGEKLSGPAARAESLLVDPAHLARVLSLLGPGVHVPAHRASDLPLETDVPSPDFPYPPATALACLRLLRTLVRAAPERAGAVLLGIQGGMTVILRWISPDEAQWEPNEDDDEPHGVRARAALRTEALLVLPSLVVHSAPLAQLALYEGALDALLAWLVARAQARREHAAQSAYASQDHLPVEADIDALEACEALLARAPGASKYFVQAQLGRQLCAIVGFPPPDVSTSSNQSHDSYQLDATKRFSTQSHVLSHHHRDHHHHHPHLALAHATDASPSAEVTQLERAFDLSPWDGGRVRIAQAAILVLTALLRSCTNEDSTSAPTVHDPTSADGEPKPSSNPKTNAESPPPPAGPSSGTQAHLTQSNVVNWLAHVVLAPEAPTLLRTQAARVLVPTIRGCLEAQAAVFRARVNVTSPPAAGNPLVAPIDKCVETGPASTTLVRLFLDFGLPPGPTDTDPRAQRALYETCLNLLSALIHGNLSARRALLLSGLDQPVSQPQQPSLPHPGPPTDADFNSHTLGLVSESHDESQNPIEALVDPNVMDRSLRELSRPSGILWSAWAAVILSVPCAETDLRAARATEVLLTLLRGSGEAKLAAAQARVRDPLPPAEPDTKTEPVKEPREPQEIPLLQFLTLVLGTDPLLWPRTHASFLRLVAQWTWDWDADGQGFLSFAPDPRAFVRTVAKPLQHSSFPDADRTRTSIPALLAALSALALVVLAVFQPATHDGETHLQWISELVPEGNGLGATLPATPPFPVDALALERAVQVANTLRDHVCFARVRPAQSQVSGSLPAPGALPKDLQLIPLDGEVPTWLGEWFDWSFVLWWHWALRKLYAWVVRARSAQGALPLAHVTPRPTELTEREVSLAKAREEVRVALTGAQHALSDRLEAEQALRTQSDQHQDALHHRALGAAAAASEIRGLRDELAVLPPAPLPGTAAAEEQDADEHEVSSDDEAPSQEALSPVSLTPDPALLDRITELQLTLREGWEAHLAAQARAHAQRQVQVQVQGQDQDHEQDHEQDQGQRTQDQTNSRYQQADVLAEAETENEDLLVLLDDLTTKRAADKVVLRQYGVELSDDEDDEE